VSARFFAATTGSPWGYFVRLSCGFCIRGLSFGLSTVIMALDSTRHGCIVHFKFEDTCAECIRLQVEAASVLALRRQQRIIQELQAELQKVKEESEAKSAFLESISDITFEKGPFYEEDVEHVLTSHTEGVPQYVRHLAKVLRDVEAIISEYHRPLLEKIGAGTET